jgi:hypothetical protein
MGTEVRHGACVPAHARPRGDAHLACLCAGRRQCRVVSVQRRHRRVHRVHVQHGRDGQPTPRRRGWAGRSACLRAQPPTRRPRPLMGEAACCCVPVRDRGATRGRTCASTWAGSSGGGSCCSRTSISCAATRPPCWRTRPVRGPHPPPTCRQRDMPGPAHTRVRRVSVCCDWRPVLHCAWRALVDTLHRVGPALRRSYSEVLQQLDRQYKYAHPPHTHTDQAFRPDV